jgi:hypothetical protein
MRKVFGCIAGLALVSACSEAPTAAAPEDVSIGVSSPGTPASVVFTLAGGAVIRTSGASNNGNGTCEAGGAYRNNGGNLASSVPHAECTTIGSGSITVTFPLTANYVLPPSGNRNLNFSACGYAEDENGDWVPVACEGQTFVHYTKNRHAMTGSGTIGGQGSDGSRWTIDLRQINGEAGNLFTGSPFGINFNFTAVRADGEEYATARLTW